MLKKLFIILTEAVAQNRLAEKYRRGELGKQGFYSSTQMANKNGTLYLTNKALGWSNGGLTFAILSRKKLI